MSSMRAASNPSRAKILWAASSRARRVASVRCWCLVGSRTLTAMSAHGHLHYIHAGMYMKGPEYDKLKDVLRSIRAIFLGCLAAGSLAWAQFGGGGAQRSTPAAAIARIRTPSRQARSPPSSRPRPARAPTWSTAPSRSAATSRAACSPRRFPPGPVTVTLADAVKLGLAANLGVLTADDSARASRAQRLRALSDLLPYVSINASETSTQVNLAAFGFKFNLPPGLGFAIPTVVGPFQYSQLLAQFEPIGLRSGGAPQLACHARKASALPISRPAMPAKWWSWRWPAPTCKPSPPMLASVRSALRWRMRRPSIIKPKFAKKPAPTLASMSRALWSNCRASSSA